LIPIQHCSRFVRYATAQLDGILFGVTGSTAGLTAEYLAQHKPAGLRWPWPDATPQCWPPPATI
jgi:hypothetical protein